MPALPVCVKWGANSLFQLSDTIMTARYAAIATAVEAAPAIVWTVSYEVGYYVSDKTGIHDFLAEAIAAGYVSVGEYVCNMGKGGKQNLRDSRFGGMSDAEISAGARNPNLDPEERRKYQREEKVRKLRNKQKRGGEVRKGESKSTNSDSTTNNGLAISDLAAIDEWTQQDEMDPLWKPAQPAVLPSRPMKPIAP